MPRRFSVNTRAFMYLFLCARDGEHCAECFAQPTELISATQNADFSATQNGDSTTIPATQNGQSRRLKIILEIDHIDNNPRNNRPQNLQLLCKPHNVGKSNRHRSSSDLSLSHKKRYRKHGNPSTQMVRNAVDFTAGTPQMQANSLYEPTFRNWILGKFEKGAEFLDKEEVINSGAETAGCSVATATTYLKKLTSNAGPLVEQRDLMGNTVIVLKPELAHE